MAHPVEVTSVQELVIDNAVASDMAHEAGDTGGRGARSIVSCISPPPPHRSARSPVNGDLPAGSRLVSHPKARPVPETDRFDGLWREGLVLYLTPFGPPGLLVAGVGLAPGPGVVGAPPKIIGVGLHPPPLASLFAPLPAVGSRTALLPPSRMGIWTEEPPAEQTVLLSVIPVLSTKMKKDASPEGN